MNFLSLEYFLAVAEELNITKTAGRLYISQQSLSNAIIRLEKSLGVQLLVRTPSLSLTYAGSKLYKYACQIVDLKARMINEIDDIAKNRRAELRIGISHTRGRAILPIILPEFKKSHPFVEITLIEDNSQTLENKLSHGMVDILFGFEPIMLDSVETTHLLKERLFLVVNRKITEEIFNNNADFMRGKFSESADIVAFKDVPFIMLKSGNRIRALMDSIFNQLGISPNIILETENIETALELAYKGLGITVYPQMFLNSFKSSYEDVDFFPLKYQGLICSLVVAHSRKRHLSKPAEDFITLAVKLLKANEIESEKLTTTNKL